MAVLVGEKPAIDEFIKNWLRHIRPGKRIVQSATVAMAARGKEFVLHESSHADWKVFERPQIKILQNFFLFKVEKIGRDFRVRPASQASFVELSQYQAEECRGHSDFRALAVCTRTGDIFYDAILGAICEQRRTKRDDFARLSFAHGSQAQTILHQGAKLRTDIIKISKVILPH